MPDRASQIATFVRDNGWGSAARETLAGDASNRRYDRLIDLQGNRSVVLMDAPPDKGESVGEFVKIADLLRGYGLSAPQILAIDEPQGFMLLEDLGDAQMARVCADNPAMEQDLYETAVDILVDLHRHPAPVDLPKYDSAMYRREARLLPEWYLPTASERVISRESLLEYDRLVAEMCGPLDAGPRILTQRDYHAENLMWLPDRAGLRRMGLLDFQGAMAGHAAYDLVSLLEDARRDTSDDLQASMKARYLASTGTDAAAFELAYCTLGAQRNLKIIGIFARLHLQDGKFTFLDLIPRVWTHLQRDLAHPGLADLRDWVSEYVSEPSSAILSKIKENPL